MIVKKMCKGFFALLIATLFLSGCSSFSIGQSEGDRIVNAAVDMLCYVNDATKELTAMYDPTKAAEMSDEELAELEQKATSLQTDMETKFDEIVKNYGFKDMQDFEAVSKNYENDKTLEEKAKAMAKSKCGIDPDEFEGEGEPAVDETAPITPVTPTTPATE